MRKLFYYITLPFVWIDIARHYFILFGLFFILLAFIF